jgi:hypothetical protein
MLKRKEIFMTTSVVTRSRESDGWWDSFRREGYYLKQTIIATLFTGMYLHISVLFLGHALVEQPIATPTLIVRSRRKRGVEP